MVMRFEVELCAVDNWRANHTHASLDEAKDYAERVKKLGIKTRIVQLDDKGRVVMTLRPPYRSAAAPRS